MALDQFSEFLGKYIKMTPEEREVWERERNASVMAERREMRLAHRRMRLQRELGDDYANAAIETHRITDGNKDAIVLAQRIIDGGFVEGCAFYGKEYGNGKTRLSACIVHAALSCDKLARFFTMAKMMKMIRAGFRDQAARHEVEAIALAPVLAIDGIDMVYLGDSGATAMYDFLDERCANGLPIITTSNRPIYELQEGFSSNNRVADSRLIGATVDRILGMTGGPENWAHVTGESERWKP